MVTGLWLSRLQLKGGDVTNAYREGGGACVATGTWWEQSLTLAFVWHRYEVEGSRRLQVHQRPARDG